MTTPAALPDEFASLEPYVQAWAVADSRARSAKRLGTAYEEIKSFYDAALAQAPAALTYLSARKLGELDACDETLLKLLLSLAEIGPAVEWYQASGVIDGFPAHRFQLTQQIPDNLAQE